MKQQAEQDIPTAASGDQDAPPDWEQIVLSTQNLYADSIGQLKGIGELAFLECERVVSSLQWWVFALAMCCVCGVMACAFVLAAALVAVTDAMFSPIATLLALGLVSALGAGLLHLSVRSIAAKMVFSTLRSHLTQSKEHVHVENRS